MATSTRFRKRIAEALTGKDIVETPSNITLAIKVSHPRIKAPRVGYLRVSDRLDAAIHLEPHPGDRAPHHGPPRLWPGWASSRVT